MKKTLVLLLFFFFGCVNAYAIEPSECTKALYESVRFAENGNDRIVDINQAKVALENMGKPYRREAEGQYEWLLYQTEGQSRYGYLCTESDYLTPLLFEDGKLVGWGKNFWATKERKYDIKIDQRIKQE